MARTKVSEYKAKVLLHEFLSLPYSGLQITNDSEEKLAQLDTAKKYVAKVDEGIKKRNKKGLVKVGLSPDEIKQYLHGLKEKGYTQFIIEEVLPHEQSEEKYISLQRVRNGIQLFYTDKGGVDIEENKESIKEVLIPFSALPDSPAVILSDNEALPAGRQGSLDSSPVERDQNDSMTQAIAPTLGVDESFILKLIEFFDRYYFSFLEINPLVVIDAKPFILDLAGEVDSVAEFFVDGAWTTEDFTTGEVKVKTEEENAIEQLSLKSQAAFKLDILNQNGSVFMLLSGGGASIVLADEVAAQGFGKELANYGEYSGNPNMEETYLYTKNILSLLSKSQAIKKVLIVGGGVANFTDVRITFRGVIKALDEVKEELQKQGVKVYVRRGGPNQTEGLAMIKDFLEKNELYGFVTGPEMVLTDIVNKAVGNV